jgi:hypothetical protein
VTSKETIDGIGMTKVHDLEKKTNDIQWSSLPSLLHKRKNAPPSIITSWCKRKKTKKTLKTTKPHTFF